MLEMHKMVIIIRSIFYDHNRYYPQVFLNKCLCKLGEKVLSCKFY